MDKLIVVLTLTLLAVSVSSYEDGQIFIIPSLIIIINYIKINKSALHCSMSIIIHELRVHLID